MKLEFFKMQAQGNDYIYFDFLNDKLPEIDLPKLSKRISDRHFGIGSDGVVLILNSKTSDARMRMFNSDGSEGQMCGSALRCVSYYLYKKTGKKTLKIETLAGIKTGQIKDAKKQLVKTDLGIPKFIQDEQVTINDHDAYLVSVGNPHFVTFMDSLSEDIAKYQGRIIDNPVYFPDGINVEFVKIINKNTIDIKVWERGSGATLACGTGACAASFCGIKLEKLVSPIEVKMPGGKVTVEYTDNNIFLTGSVEFVYNGTIEI